MSLINLFCISSLRSDTLIRRLFTVGASVINETEQEYDIIVVGGGIVGTATARELALRHPKLKLALVEKENKLGLHQTGRNSGVIHAGIYYKPGSLKAKLCVEGAKLAYKYCDEKKIEYKKVGKLIVAVDDDELPRLDELYHRGQENGVKDLKILEKDDIKKYEPNCSGLRAIWSPHTGIVDWGLVNKSFGDDFRSLKGQIHYNFEVKSFEYDKSESEAYPLRIYNKKDGKRLKSRYIVTAAGVYSDRIAKLTGGNPYPRIVPFRGEYLVMRPEKCDLIRSNIYPVPDPRFPFLGVHFTPRIDGSVWLGPNAVLAFKREGYKKSEISIRDSWDALSFSGFQKLAFKYFSAGIKELYRSYRTKAQVDILRKYVPKLELTDIEPGVYKSGIRAQAMDENGNLIEDFVFDTASDEFGKRVLHVRNAPSPGATSSLAIAKMIADKVQHEFQIDK